MGGYARVYKGYLGICWCSISAKAVFFELEILLLPISPLDGTWNFLQ